MNKEEIPDLLFTRALAQVFSPAIPIVQQGMTEIPKSGEYIELQYLPNDTTNLSVGNDAASLHQGFLQCTVVWPMGEGIVAPIAIAGQIVEYWTKGTLLYGTGFKLKIYRQPFDTQPIKDGKWWRVPVSIPYQVLAR